MDAYVLAKAKGGESETGEKGKEGDPIDLTEPCIFKELGWEPRQGREDGVETEQTNG